VQVAIWSNAFRASAAENGSPPDEKLRFQGSLPTLKKTAKDLGAGYDLNRQCEAGKLSGRAPKLRPERGVPRTRVDRVLNTISQAEPRLRHSQEVFPITIVGRFVRQINTGPGIGTILTFLAHNFMFPTVPSHCDKSGTALAFRRERKSTERLPQKLQRPKSGDRNLNHLHSWNDERAQTEGLRMRPFMFLCPTTGYIVRAQADDAAPGEKPHTFHLISCASCGRTHLVDPGTGELAVGIERSF
jgi:hypothetical protein